MKKTVYQCDRCGEKIDFPREKMIAVSYNEQNADPREKMITVSTVSAGSYNEQNAYSSDIIHGRMDYCISCFKEFEKFMKMNRSNILWE